MREDIGSRATRLIVVALFLDILKSNLDGALKMFPIFFVVFEIKALKGLKT